MRHFTTALSDFGPTAENGSLSDGPRDFVRSTRTGQRRAWPTAADDARLQTLGESTKCADTANLLPFDAITSGLTKSSRPNPHKKTACTHTHSPTLPP